MVSPTATGAPLPCISALPRRVCACAVLLTDGTRRPLYDLEHGRRAIGYDPQQKSIVTEDFQAGRMDKDPVLHANL
eukprot:SAG11_NODE_11821_length_736_cov_1.588697_2_plen_76_part_00